VVRAINRLTARQVETLTEPGRHADGGNLYLSIAPTGGRRWVFLYRWDGKTREMGLGSAAKTGVSLADARKLAKAARDRLSAGIDPLRAKEAARLSALTIPTFGTMADELIAVMKPGWRNPKHAAQWTYTLTELAKSLRAKPVDQIDTHDVLEVLKPLWQQIPETASRVRGRIEAVLNAAKAKGYHLGENPARWRGHLDQLLPKRQRLTRGHHAALSYDKLPGFMVKLREREQSIAGLALEFTILTATRTNETINARWSELDVDKGVWEIPAERMKGGRPHRVPLSDRAKNIVRTIGQVRQGGYVFAGSNPKRPLSTMAMAMYLRRMGYPDITVHGFRSTFRDWASETTSFPHEICEMALAHVIENKAEAAYRRGDLFEKRRKLMTAWAAYCEPREIGKVIPLAKGAKR
jgi:integrase